MSTDETAHIDVVDRQLTSRQVEGAEAIVTLISRDYQTTPEDLWDAVTNPERLPRWFAPVSGDLRLDGRYQVEGNAAGTITGCEPPRSFQATWEFEDSVSWITVMISEDDGDGARFTLEHTGHIPADFWDQFGPGATGVGWDLALLGLAWHLQSPGSAMPDDEQWAASESGREFIAASSRRWAQASVAFGTGPDHARAAEERTTAFYTGASD